jgi:Flp pilus assembly protein protease CpaA
VILVVFSLIYICLRDLRSHIITNRSILVLSASLYFSLGREIHFMLGTITLISLTILGMGLSIGGGDIKLISVLVFFGDVEFSFNNYLLISLLVGTVHLLIHLLKNRTMSGRLPLAPAIAVPMFFSLALR